MLSCRALILVCMLWTDGESFVLSSARIRDQRVMNVAPLVVTEEILRPDTVAEKVQNWLDEEWIEQECHERIAKFAAKSYATAIAEEKSMELGSVLVKLCDDLSGSELKSDFFDAYVGPYDVANFVSELLAQEITEGASCSCDAPTEEDLVAKAAKIRNEVALLEAEIKDANTVNNQGGPFNYQLKDSVWKFTCKLSYPRRRFTFEACLQPDGSVELLNTPNPNLRRALVWNIEKDTNDTTFLRLSILPEPDLLAENDGQNLYLNARLEKRANGAIVLEDGTLTVKRSVGTSRFLFFEYPSLLAEFIIVGSFTSLPI